MEHKHQYNGVLRRRINAHTGKREFCYFLNRPGAFDPNLTVWFSMPAGQSWPSSSESEMMANAIAAGRNVAVKFDDIRDAAEFVVALEAAEIGDDAEAVH